MNIEQLFGFRFVKDEKQKTLSEKTPINTIANDGAYVINSGSVFSTQIDINGYNSVNENEFITKYRELASSAEASQAVREIVNEAIVDIDNDPPVSINTDTLNYSESFIETIRTEFKNILNLLDFSNIGWDIFYYWYVDGRLFFQIVIDEKNPAKGIKELRYIDPRKIRKIKQVQKQRDPSTGVELVVDEVDFYIYSEQVQGTNPMASSQIFNGSVGATKFTADSIAYIHSGLVDATYNFVVSPLHKAIRPINHLRYVEDSIVVYRLSRAAERRIFYIDVGDLSAKKAEEHMQDLIKNYRNKMSYDSATGKVRDDKRFMSILEDFWFPRRNGTNNTEVKTLESGQNLGKLEDLAFFEKKVRRSLDLPISRMESENGFNLGKSSEINRDERNFARYVSGLQKKFSKLFDTLLSTQLRLKGKLTKEEWREISPNIKYVFRKDSYYQEQQELEVLQSRIGILPMIQEYVGEGRYFSDEYVKKKILRQTQEEIDAIVRQNKGRIPQLPVGTNVGMPVGVPGTDFAPPEFQFQQGMFDKLKADSGDLSNDETDAMTKDSIRNKNLKRKK